MGRQLSNSTASAAVGFTSSDVEFRQFESDVSKIGTGMLGGKVECLAAVAQALHTEARRNPKIAGCVFVPHMYVIATDFFDAFMVQNGLCAKRFASMSDAEISLTIAKATLPGRLIGELGVLVEKLRNPLVVRSSGLLETALYRGEILPYAARLLPNSEPAALLRLEELTRAVKAVWASLFLGRVNVVSQGPGKSPSGEKMAVVIQEVFGRKAANLFFPDVSCKTVSPNRNRGYKSERTAIVDAVPGLIRENFSKICGTETSPFHGPWAIDLNSSYDEDDIVAARCRLVSISKAGTLDGAGIRSSERIDPTVLMAAPVDELLTLGERMVGGPVEIHFAVRAVRGAAFGAETAILKVSPTFNR